MYGFTIRRTDHCGDYAETPDEVCTDYEVFVSVSRDAAYKAACRKMEQMMKQDPDLGKLLPDSGRTLTEEDLGFEAVAVDSGQEGNVFRQGYAHLVMGLSETFDYTEDMEYIQMEVLPVRIEEVSSALEDAEMEYCRQDNLTILEFLNDCQGLSLQDKKDFLEHYSQDEAFKVKEDGKVVPKYTPEEARTIAKEWTDKDGIPSFVVQCPDGAVGIVSAGNLGNNRTIGEYCVQNHCTLLSVIEP